MAPSRVQKIKRDHWTTIRLCGLPKFDQKGSCKCRIHNCRTCCLMWHQKRHIVGTDGRTFPIKQFINWGTSYVVYGLLCPCSLLYVGRTSRPLRVWTFITKEATTLCRHFKEAHGCNYLYMSCFGIKVMPNALDNGRRQRFCRPKSYWIFTLNCLALKGLNEELENHRFM